MIEIIPSKHAREALQGKRIFTDFEKATLIWNSPIANIKYPEHSVIDNCAITEVGYDGRENVWASYNAMGEMKDFYSNEIPDINYEASADNARFEDGFFKIPAVIETGTVAKIAGEDTYVVICYGMSSWDEYMDRIRIIEYFKELTEVKDSKALDACRKYADICARDKRRVYRVESIRNIWEVRNRAI